MKRLFADSYGTKAILEINEQLGELYNGKKFWITYQPTFTPLCYKTLNGALKKLEKDGFKEVQ